MAVIRSIVSVSISGSGENDISAVSLKKSKASGVERIEGVVIKESVSILDSGGVRSEMVGGLGSGDVLVAGSDFPEHHSKRMRD
jgi:hypothetical protein